MIESSWRKTTKFVTTLLFLWGLVLILDLDFLLSLTDKNVISNIYTRQELPQTIKIRYVTQAAESIDAF